MWTELVYVLLSILQSVRYLQTRKERSVPISSTVKPSLIDQARRIKVLLVESRTEGKFRKL